MSCIPSLSFSKTVLTYPPGLYRAVHPGSVVESVEEYKYDHTGFGSHFAPRASWWYAWWNATRGAESRTKRFPSPTRGERPLYFGAAGRRVTSSLECTAHIHVRQNGLLRT